MALDAKTCVVTGASRGIGRGIAEELGRHGANVTVDYRSSEEPAHEVVEQIESNGGAAIAVQADVTDRDRIEHLREEVLDAFGSVDVLVNNAGLNVDTGFSEMDQQNWDRVIDVHLGGMFRCTDAFFEDIRDADAGRLINISSIVGKQGNYGQANYATAKSGMFGFTRTLALELAQTGSTANCIAPGFIATDMLSSIPDTVQEQLLDDIPLDRFGSAEEVAHLARYLASDESSYVTGEVIDVNGGKDL
jgi:3-oxoacyl-[acyl-carrier protein] reductase